MIFHSLVENVELCKIFTDSGKYLFWLYINAKGGQYAKFQESNRMVNFEIKIVATVVVLFQHCPLVLIRVFFHMCDYLCACFYS